MDITPLISQEKNIINSYGSEGFKINDKLYVNSLILTPNQVIEISINSIEDFFEQNLKNIFEIDPEILIIGTGESHIIIPLALKNKIKNIYPLISIDEMTTASACRTYNVLMMEDRNVGVLLIKID